MAAGLAVLLAGCAVGLDSMPMPSPGASGKTYALTAIFSDALNLPAQAHVKLLGADIGEVDAIRAHDFTAQVDMRIRSDVPLRVGSTAELRSATLIGDVFVSIKPSADAKAPLLRNGDTIPLKSTAAAPTVEDVLNSMAMLVNGGTIRYLVNSINGAGQAMGGRGEKVGLLLDQSTTLLSKMNARSDQLDSALRRTSELSASMAARSNTLSQSLEAGAPALAVIADNTDRIANLADSTARITRQLSRFPSIQGTDTRSTVADLNHLAETFNDIAVDPNLSLYSLNRLLGVLLKAFDATSVHVEVTLDQLALAAWPDINYPGDPGFHPSDGTDWHQLVESLRYEWNLLLAKIYGEQR
ncbi:MCE family protein [Mycobacterium talmoniae]|uniref:Lipoprotein LprN n=1 Tax=Mycobacterium talmoniae TaxID=1858794 RepID=A0A1S1NM63_9MYCO|nr:MCE family protein [Mycobacterium talmoniae]OHV05071.1 mammalian cell entry protein [Mycobacterium talmoniae]PQM45433.1 Lipoprotein LprN [Mycobacterium talmoniae]